MSGVAELKIENKNDSWIVSGPDTRFNINQTLAEFKTKEEAETFADLEKRRRAFYEVAKAFCKNLALQNREVIRGFYYKTIPQFGLKSSCDLWLEFDLINADYSCIFTHEIDSEEAYREQYQEAERLGQV